jgi:hypothetical protein
MGALGEAARRAPTKQRSWTSPTVMPRARVRKCLCSHARRSATVRAGHAPCRPQAILPRGATPPPSCEPVVAGVSRWQRSATLQGAAWSAIALLRAVDVVSIALQGATPWGAVPDGLGRGHLCATSSRRCRSSISGSKAAARDGNCSVIGLGAMRRATPWPGSPQGSVGRWRCSLLAP